MDVPFYWKTRLSIYLYIQTCNPVSVRAVAMLLSRAWGELVTLTS